MKPATTSPLLNTLLEQYPPDSPKDGKQADALASGCPADFVPICEETRTHVSTAVMCRHLNRAQQTARGWACLENGPLRCIRINGRLAWPVSEIRRLLGVPA